MIYTCTVIIHCLIVLLVIADGTKPNQKTSVIWEFFTVGEDTKFGIGDTCEAKVPRGGDTTKSFTTTNLVHHLTFYVHA